MLYVCSFRIDACVILKDFKKYLILSDKAYSEYHLLGEIHDVNVTNILIIYS